MLAQDFVKVCIEWMIWRLIKFVSILFVAAENCSGCITGHFARNNFCYREKLWHFHWKYYSQKKILWVIWSFTALKLFIYNVHSIKTITFSMDLSIDLEFIKKIPLFIAKCSGTTLSLLTLWLMRFLIIRFLLTRGATARMDHVQERSNTFCRAQGRRRNTQEHL